MLNKQINTALNSKIVKFLFFSSLLISIPVFNNVNVKAGLEFQWDQDSGYRRLRWFQKNEGRRARNSIFFFLRPSDRKAELLKINMKLPKYFNSTLKEEKISLCKVLIGGYQARTKCLDDIPADVEISEDKKSIDIFPYTPIPSNKDSYAVVYKVYNPKKAGMFQFHSFGQYSGKKPALSYLGSWNIVIGK